MQPPALIDIGINLAHDSFDHDRVELIERARQAGLVAMVVTGSSVESSEQAIALCQQWPQLLRSTVGLHPHHATDLSAEALARLDALMSDPWVCAAGECGLDYYRNYSPPADQRRAFEQQLELAVRHQLPVFLHAREAHADFIAILGNYLPQLPRAVLHCFTGSESELEACLALDLYIGITGWVCDERRGLELQKMVGRIPADRLMLESDGPYLLPRTLSPKPADRRNEPAFLSAVLATVARCRKEPEEVVAEATTANACRFFALKLLASGRQLEVGNT